MRTQQEFMMIFRFEPNTNHTPSEQEIAEMHQQWGAFIGNLAIAEKLVSTNRLSFEGKQVHADSTISNGMVLCDKAIVSGYLVTKAASLDEATELAKSCPILHMGGSVEVRGITPMES